MAKGFNNKIQILPKVIAFMSEWWITWELQQNNKSEHNKQNEYIPVYIREYILRKMFKATSIAQIQKILRQCRVPEYEIEKLTGVVDN